MLAGMTQTATSCPERHTPVGMLLWLSTHDDVPSNINKLDCVKHRLYWLNDAQDDWVQSVVILPELGPQPFIVSRCQIKVPSRSLLQRNVDQHASNVALEFIDHKMKRCMIGLKIMTSSEVFNVEEITDKVIRALRPLEQASEHRTLKVNNLTSVGV